MTVWKPGYPAHGRQISVEKDSSHLVCCAAQPALTPVRLRARTFGQGKHMPLPATSAHNRSSAHSKSVKHLQKLVRTPPSTRDGCW